jgi:hypothetical protein
VGQSPVSEAPGERGTTQVRGSPHKLSRAREGLGQLEE